MSLIFIFLDGVGLAPAGLDNPLTDANMPVLRELLGGPLVAERAQVREDLLLKAIDATLGVPGLPQSGTGQTALLTGVNAAELHGRHQPHTPPVALRPLLAERNVLRRVVARGGRATFANAFGPRYWDAVVARRIRRSASVIAAEGAGLRFRDMDDLRAGRALAWDVTGAALRERELAAGLRIVTPQEAGANLACLADEHDLVFYESFLPDLAGHGRLQNGGSGGTKQRSTDDSRNLQSTLRDTQHTSDQLAREQIDVAMSLLDGLIGGALGGLRPQDSLLITSDHGNVESRAAPAHTRNPVPLLVAGPAAPAFVGVVSIADLADAIMSVLDFES